MGNSFYRQFDYDRDIERSSEIHNKLARIEENTKGILEVLERIDKKFEIQQEVVSKLHDISDANLFPSADKILLESLKERILSQLRFEEDKAMFIFNESERRILKNNPGLKSLLVQRKYKLDDENDPPKYLRL